MSSALWGQQKEEGGGIRSSVSGGRRKHFLENPQARSRAAGTALGPLLGKQVPG